MTCSLLWLPSASQFSSNQAPTELNSSNSKRRKRMRSLVHTQQLRTLTHNLYACTIKGLLWTQPHSHGTGETRERGRCRHIFFRTRFSLFQAPIVRSAGIQKARENENKTGGNWKEEGRITFTFASSPLFRVFYTIWEPGTGYTRLDFSSPHCLPQTLLGWCGLNLIVRA